METDDNGFDPAAANVQPGDCDDEGGGYTDELLPDGEKPLQCDDDNVQGEGDDKQGERDDGYDDYLAELLGSIDKEQCNGGGDSSGEQLLVPCTAKRVSIQVETLPFGSVRYEEVEEDGVSTTTITRKPKIPDGGWGWMVVFASLMICLISDGISFSFGLLYIEFLKEFQESKSKTAWIGALFMAVPLILGPVGSALVDKYGCRKMTILGGIISGLGFIISSFAQSIEMVFFTFGFLSGLGLCLCYVTAVVSIAYWFDKKRTLATGLGACGTGIGTLLYAPLTQYSIEEYGWRGTVLLLAGTFFNFCVCGALMRDPDWLIAEQKKPPAAVAVASVAAKPWADTEESIVDHCSMVAIENEKAVPGGTSSGGSGLPEVPQYSGIEQYRRLVKEAQGAEYHLTGVTTTVRRPSDVHRHASNNQNGFRSVINLPTYVKHNEKVRIFLFLIAAHKCGCNKNAIEMIYTLRTMSSYRIYQ